MVFHPVQQVTDSPPFFVFNRLRDYHNDRDRIRFSLSAKCISNLGPNSLTSALANVRLDRPGKHQNLC